MTSEMITQKKRCRLSNQRHRYHVPLKNIPVFYIIRLEQKKINGITDVLGNIKINLTYIYFLKLKKAENSSFRVFLSHENRPQTNKKHKQTEIYRFETWNKAMISISQNQMKQGISKITKK